MTKSGIKENPAWFGRLHIIYKFLVCALLATGCTLLTPVVHLDLTGLLRIIFGWDVFCVLLLAFYWHSFFTTPHLHIRQQSAKEDSSRIIIFFIILVATFASLLAVILLLTTRRSGADIQQLYLPIATMVLSWLLVHSVFAVRYAHLYYGNHKTNPHTHAGGLQFPDDDRPDFLDFAYFSFVLGMTFQVSDVTVTSKTIRRWALWHGLIAFAYNTVIVALTINIIAGLSN